MAKNVAMTTSKHEIRAWIAKGLNAQVDRIIRQLYVIGEKCLNDARISGSYTDQTGNLRGSTGYCIVVDGEIQTVAGFQPVKGAKEGPAKGSEYIRKIASETPGIALILVAGMHYARYVADRGYNVLDSAEILADKLVSELQKSVV